jgi:hypothetical protein
VPETSAGLVAFAGQVDKAVQRGVNSAFALIGDQVAPLVTQATSLPDLAQRITMDWPVTLSEATELTSALERAVGIPAKFFLGQSGVPVIGDRQMLKFNQVDWAKRHSMGMVTDISFTTQQSMMRSLGRSIQEAAPLDLTANRLRRYIGLDTRYAQAVDNFYRAQIERGVLPFKAHNQARAYAGRLRTARARAIAQTETTRALWEGQRQYWDQLVDEQAVDPSKLRKRWRTHRDERVCLICKPMHNVTIGWWDKWVLPNGTPFDGPPAHTNCRCEVTVLWSRYVVSKQQTILSAALGV